MTGAAFTEAINKSVLEELRANLSDIELIESDGVPMDSDWHRRCMNLLIDQIEHHFRDRDDFYVGGNMFVYFSLEQARNKDFRGPDFFFVKDTNRLPERRFWVVWEENGRTPNVVIELSSPTTEDEDHTSKFKIYRDQLRVRDYFIYEPYSQTLEGWRLDGSRYRPLAPDAAGRLFSEELGLSLGIWKRDTDGVLIPWLRFFDRDGIVLPLPAEAERIKAEAEKQRADAEKQRAEAAEAENARLRALLAKQTNSTNGVNPH